MCYSESPHTVNLFDKAKLLRNSTEYSPIDLLSRSFFNVIYFSSKSDNKNSGNKTSFWHLKLFVIGNAIKLMDFTAAFFTEISIQYFGKSNQFS